VVREALVVRCRSEEAWAQWRLKRLGQPQTRAWNRLWMESIPFPECPLFKRKKLVDYSRKVDKPKFNAKYPSNAGDLWFKPSKPSSLRVDHFFPSNEIHTKKGQSTTLWDRGIHNDRKTLLMSASAKTMRF
jgi:hypothetical protein